MNNGRLLVLAIVLVAIGALGIIGINIFNYSGSNLGARTNNGNGNGAVMGMGRHNSGALTTNSTVNNAVSHETQGTVNKANNSITFTQSSINLTVLAAPPAHPGDYFEIDNLIKPTLYINKGTTVHITLVNEDNIMHGFEVVAASPPFSNKPMMSYSPLFSSFIMPIRGTNTNQYHSADKTMTVTSTGTYYYICPVPHHAAMGMYGKLVVS